MATVSVLPNSITCSIVEKPRLLRCLKILNILDHGSSPFIAIKLCPNGEFPKFYRAGNTGLIRSSSAISAESGWIFVSLAHFQDCLKVIEEDKVQLSIDGGVLKLNSINTSFDTEIRVHTVRSEIAGMKNHAPGQGLMSIDPKSFYGFDIRPFNLAGPSVLSGGKIVFPTDYAIIHWQGPDSLKDAKLFPRETFLKFISGADPAQVFLTSSDYWAAELGEFLIFLSGHKIGQQLFDVYNVPGVEIAKFSAARLIYALGAAASLSGNDSYVELNSVDGVLTRDKFGNQSKFGVSSNSGKAWKNFKIFSKTAKAIVDAFAQTREEEILMFNVKAGIHPTIRFQRGNWTVDCKVF